MYDVWVRGDNVPETCSYHVCCRLGTSRSEVPQRRKYYKRFTNMFVVVNKENVFIIPYTSTISHQQISSKRKLQINANATTHTPKVSSQPFPSNNKPTTS